MGQQPHAELQRLASDDNNSNQVGYYERIDDRSQLPDQLAARITARLSAAITVIKRAMPTLTSSANYQEGDYTSGGLNIGGGATLTAKGGALHRTSINGGSRLMVDVSAIASRLYPSPATAHRWYIPTRLFGKAVIVDVSDYYRSGENRRTVAGRRGKQPLHRSERPDGRAIGYRRLEGAQR